MVGDPGYDPWPLLEQLDDPFEHPDPEAVLGHRLALVADAVGEEPRRLAAWAVARRVEAVLELVAEDELADARVAMDEVPTLAGLAGL